MSLTEQEQVTPLMTADELQAVSDHDRRVALDHQAVADDESHDDRTREISALLATWRSARARHWLAEAATASENEYEIAAELEPEGDGQLYLVDACPLDDETPVTADDPLAPARGVARGLGAAVAMWLIILGIAWVVYVVIAS